VKCKFYTFSLLIDMFFNKCCTGHLIHIHKLYLFIFSVYVFNAIFPASIPILLTFPALQKRPQIEENELRWTCGMDRRQERGVQGFSRVSFKKKKTWEA